MKYLERIIESGLFSEIDKTKYIAAFECLKISARKFERNETIFFEGDLIDKICIVDKGSVRSEKTYYNGEVHIAEIYEEGSVFAVAVAASKTKEAALDYVSNSDSLVVFISMQSIERAPYSEELKTALMYKMADSSIKMSHKIEVLAERGLRDRILVYLNVLAKKARSNRVTVRMNREQMSQYLCVNRSALSNELNKMKREGVIDFERNKFTLLNGTSNLSGDK